MRIAEALGGGDEKNTHIFPKFVMRKAENRVSTFQGVKGVEWGRQKRRKR